MSETFTVQIKFSITFIYSFLCILILFDSSKSQAYDNAKINCFIRHLKEQKILPQNFEEKPTIRDISHCEKIVEHARDLYRNRITVTAILDIGPLNLENMLEKERTCFDNQIKAQNIGDYMLKLIIYRSMDLVNFNLVIDQEKTRDHIMDIISYSTSNCTFGIVYDTFDNQRVKNFVKRKYVIDHDILGLKEYNLTLNPFNVDIPKIDYEALIAKIVQEESAFIEEKIKEERSNNEVSAKHTFKFENDEALTFLSRNWAVIFLTELNISSEEREKKQQQYTKELIEFQRKKNIIPLDDGCCAYVRV